MLIVASAVHATLIMTMSENSWLNRLIDYILNEFQIIKQLSRIIKHNIGRYNQQIQIYNHICDLPTKLF